MDPVPQRGRHLDPMRIVHHHRKPALGAPSAHHPVVAADVVAVAGARLPVFVLRRRRGRAEADRRAEGRVEIENRLVDQRAIDGRIQRDGRIAALEVFEVLHPVRSEHADGLRDPQLFLEVRDERVVPGDHDRRRPRGRRDAEQLELQRQGGRILHGLGDVRVHAAHERRDDFFAVRVIRVQLALQIAAEHVQARADVACELLASEDLRHGAGRLPPPQLELKEPIAGGGVALREEEVALVRRVDVIDAPAVAQDLDRFGEAVDAQRDGCRRRAAKRSKHKRGDPCQTHPTLPARQPCPPGLPVH